MYGAHIGSLAVYEIADNNEISLLWFQEREGGETLHLLKKTGDRNKIQIKDIYCSVIL